MPRTLKRRSDAISRDISPEPTRSPEPPRQRQRSSSETSSESYDGEDPQSQAAAVIDNLIKKLVRLALATEHSRTPLRRTDISSKIFKDAKDTASSRSFKAVFAGAQKVLQNTFGMQLEELPSREKTTLKDRRAQATQTKSGNTSTKSWILVSTLPKPYKTNQLIIQPSRGPSSETEAGYTAMYTFILALIYMNNGALAEQKLERYLRRVNADTLTPFGNLDKLLQRLTREGYIEKRRDTSSGEEIIEWLIGPRGKIEVGANGVVGLVKSVYGADNVDEDDLNARLNRSLGVNLDVGQRQDEPEGNDNAAAAEEEDNDEAGPGTAIDVPAARETSTAGVPREPRARARPTRSRNRTVANDDDDDE